MARYGIPVAFILIILTVSNHVEADYISSIPYVEETLVVVDGNIAKGEYGGAFNETATGIVVHWEHNGSHIKVGLLSPGSGWLSIGFGPKGVGMDGANIIISYVEEDGSFVIIDAVGIGWNHFPDDEKSGEDDISEASASLHDKRVILEFVFPLASGDGLDHSFKANETQGYFLAYHETARDTVTIHTVRSDSLVLFIEPAPQTPTDTSDPWIQENFYVLASFALLVLVGFSAWYLRRPRVIKFKRSDGWSEP
jgi:hypothetical protein